MPPHDLIANLYRSAVSTEQCWQGLGETRQFLGADIVSVFGCTKGSFRHDHWSSHADPDFSGGYKQTIIRGLALQEQLAKLASGSILRDAWSLLETDERKAVYRAWLEGWGLRQELGMVLADPEFGALYLVYHWAQVQKEGAIADAVAKLTRLKPHLEISLKLCRRMEERAAKEDALLWLMDHSPHGIALLDDDLQVISANREAKHIFSEKDALSARSDRRPGGSVRIRDILRDIELPTALDDGALLADRGQELVLPQRKDRLPVIVTAKRISPRKGNLPCQSKPSIVLFLRDTEKEHEMSFGAFVSAFRLTSAEARLVNSLARGKSLNEHASEEKTSPQTARWHLKNVYSKTHCRGLVNLINLYRRFVMPRL